MSDSDSDSDSSIEEGQYVVEDIIKHRIVNGKLQFLLKWKGYDDNENSWINQKELHCDDILNRYLSKNRAQIDEDLAKNNKKKKSRKKLTEKQNSSPSHQEIKKQTNANIESSQNKVNDESSTGSILSNINKEKLKLNENSPKIGRQQQNNTSVTESDSDVVEISEIIINESKNNENINKKSNEISLEIKNSSDQSTTKSSTNSTINSSIDPTTKSSINSTIKSSVDPTSINSESKSLNNSVFVDSEPKFSTDSTSKSLSDSNSKNPLNSIINPVVSDVQSHSEEDFTVKIDYKIIAILSHEINGSKIMCNCLTDKINCVKIPVNQVKKTNLNAYLKYLESEVVNPF